MKATILKLVPYAKRPNAREGSVFSVEMNVDDADEIITLLEAKVTSPTHMSYGEQKRIHKIIDCLQAVVSLWEEEAHKDE